MNGEYTQTLTVSKPFFNSRSGLILTQNIFIVITSFTVRSQHERVVRVLLLSTMSTLPGSRLGTGFVSNGLQTSLCEGHVCDF